MYKIISIIIGLLFIFAIGFSFGKNQNNFQDLTAEDWYNMYAEQYNNTIDLEEENKALKELINPSKPLQSPVI